MNIPLLKGNNLQNNTEMVIDDVLEKRIPKPILGNILYNFNGGYTVKGITSSFITNVYFRARVFSEVRVWLSCHLRWKDP